MASTLDHIGMSDILANNFAICIAVEYIHRQCFCARIWDVMQMPFISSGNAAFFL